MCIQDQIQAKWRDGTIKSASRCKGFRTCGNFQDTFAPVSKLVTVRTLLAVAVKMDWHTHQFDAKITFLHGDLHEHIDMKYYKALGNKITTTFSNKKKLFMAQISLKELVPKKSQSPCNNSVSSNPKPNTLYSCLKKKTYSLRPSFIYVDDVIITRNNMPKIQQTKDFLDKKFSIKDLGPLKLFLGIEVAQKNGHGS